MVYASQFELGESVGTSVRSRSVHRGCAQLAGWPGWPGWPSLFTKGPDGPSVVRIADPTDPGDWDHVDIRGGPREAIGGKANRRVLACRRRVRRRRGRVCSDVVKVAGWGRGRGTWKGISTVESIMT